MSKGWDSTALKKLKALTGKGLSTAEIGKRLGMSKNAIVGKLNRLGWNAKAGGAANADDKKKVAKLVTTKKPALEKDALGAKKANVKVESKKTVAKKTAKMVTKKTDDKKSPGKEIGVKVKRKEETPRVQTKTSAKTNAKSLAVHQRIIQHSLEMANLKPNQCRWPIGDPDSEHFHFCGETVFVGKPYCYEHCKQAYQFAPPKKK